MDTMDPDVRDYRDMALTRDTSAEIPHPAAAAVKSASGLLSFKVGAFAPMNGPGDVLFVHKPGPAGKLPLRLPDGMVGSVLSPEEATAIGLHLISCAERVRRNSVEG